MTDVSNRNTDHPNGIEELCRLMSLGSVVGTGQRLTVNNGLLAEKGHVLIAGLSRQKKTQLKAGFFIGAGGGIRTPDVNLGKVALYH